jgi:hypothetical protein
MSAALEQRVRAEVEDLHAFFFGWFTGALAPEEFESQFLARFSRDMVFIPPAGRLQGLAELSTSIRDGHGSNADFRVCIRNVTLQRAFDGHVLATYEEWQRNALASTPSDNGRLATVLFKDGDPLQWLHIHETWLPPDISAAGPYDF